MREIAVAACLLLSASTVSTESNQVASYKFENGVWFDGQAFSPQSPYIVDSLLKFTDAPLEATVVVDLDGKFVIPPLCEAHNHNLGDSAETDEVRQTIDTYLRHGVYYVLMQGSFDLYRDLIVNDVNHPESVDVAFANNGLTGSGGHPRRLREFLMERFDSYPEFTPETLPDAGYFEVDTPEDLEKKWALILAEKPDLVKAMLLFSEEYELRKDDPDYYGERGLDPALLPELVRLAHAADLRVSVHVETDADMATALQAGADIIAHLPSHDSTVRISDETIALAVDSNAALISTLSLAGRLQSRDPDQYELVLEAQRDNLSRLVKAGANLVVGSDNVRGISDGEATHLANLGVLDHSTILKMWTENCARTVFPDRDIGRLADGFEASFVVLEDDPLVNLDAVANISLRVKDGQVLELESGE